MDRQKESEGKAFTAFLRAHPSLDRDIANWDQPEGFPDAHATLKNGSEIGFELGELVVEKEIAKFKKLAAFDSDLSNARRQQGNNLPKNINRVLLEPKSGCNRFDPNDRQRFWCELLNLISRTDQQWPQETHWKRWNGYHCRDFGNSPTLAKYLSEVWFLGRMAGSTPREPPRTGTPWINVKSRGGSYSGEATREALETIMSQKLQKYGGPCGYPVRLLIHYGASAFSFNTPFWDAQTPDFRSLAERAHQIAKTLLGRPAYVFEGVYLCNTVLSELEAYEVHPTFTRCN